MYYKIRNTLEAIRAEEIFDGDDCYVAVISPEKWARDKENSTWESTSSSR